MREVGGYDLARRVGDFSRAYRQLANILGVVYGEAEVSTHATMFSFSTRICAGNLPHGRQILCTLMFGIIQRSKIQVDLDLFFEYLNSTEDFSACKILSGARRS